MRELSETGEVKDFRVFLLGVPNDKRLNSACQNGKMPGFGALNLSLLARRS